jgi:hypothetical protein
VSRGPDFDDLVGDVDGLEAERLRRVHDLLVTAGPPPELTPQMEAGPTLAMTLGRRGRRPVQRRVALLAAAIVVLLVAFLAGYIAANDRTASGHLLRLQGTAAAPGAQASLRIQEVDPSGNWPMELAALGLPKLPAKTYYEVFLVRDGKIDAPCGSFKVRSATDSVSVHLNAPYRLDEGDSWVVTRQHVGDRTPGTVVLKPVT